MFSVCSCGVARRALACSCVLLVVVLLTLCYRSSDKRSPTSVLVHQSLFSFLLCRPEGLCSCALDTNDRLTCIFNSGVIYESTETYDEDRKMKAESKVIDCKVVGTLLFFLAPPALSPLRNAFVVYMWCCSSRARMLLCTVPCWNRSMASLLVPALSS